MNALIIYMVKSAIYLAGLYLIYFLFMSRDTIYGRNRSFILVSVMLSFIMPLINFNIRENTAFYYLGKTLSEIVATTGGQPAITGNDVLLKTRQT